MEELTCLLNTPGLRVLHDSANQWLYSQWLGQHDGESMQRHTELVCACLQTQPSPKILSDHSLLTGDWQQAAPGCRHAFERMAAQGVAYFAWVYAPAYTDRLAMEKAMLHIARPAVAIFDDISSAYEWLRRMPNYPPEVRWAQASERLPVVSRAGAC